MKICATLLTSLSFTLLLSASAMAEPFNNRGHLFTDTAPAGTQEPRQAVSPAPNWFNERDGFFITEAPSGSEKPRPPVEAIPQGFNDQSHFAEGTQF